MSDTVDSVEISSQEESTILPELPGTLLREAREAAGISLGEVAGALKFSVRQIEMLERNEYGQLSAGTFIRGFIRSYGRFLKLDADYLLRLLETEVPKAEVEIVAPTNMGDATPSPFLERNFKWVMGALVAIVVLAVAGFLALSNLDHDDAAPSATLENTSPVVSSQPATAVSAAAPAPSSSPEAVNSAAGGQATAVLKIDFLERSWIEVKDGSQKIVLTGEYPAGAHQALDARGPFQLWIGKASGVKVTYQDKPVDLQPFIRDDVARLSLE